MDGGAEEKARGWPGVRMEEDIPPEPSDDELAEIEEETIDPDGPEGGFPVGDAVDMYLKEIRAVPLLTADAEIRLARRISAGSLARELLDGPLPDDPDPVVLAELERFAGAGERARQEMTEANLRLVVSVARRYLGRGLPLPDLIQEGNIGLMQAVAKYDHTRGFRFSTYATWRIRQAVSRAVADQGRAIRVPVHMADAIGRITRVFGRLQQELGRDPSPEEIAGKADMAVEKVRKIMEIAREPVSLDTPVGDGDSLLGDFVPDEVAGDPVEAAISAQLSDQMADALDTLRPKEARVLRLRFGLDDGRERTLEEVGRELGVTRERIRQIELAALRKLRHPARSRKLRDYWA